MERHTFGTRTAYAVLACLWMTAATARADSALLVKESTRIGTPATFAGLSQEYFWTSPSTVLILRCTDLHTGDFNLFRVDAPSGDTTPLASFNKRFTGSMVGVVVFSTNSPGNRISAELPCCLSRDGKTLIWKAAGHYPSKWIAASLSGSHLASWPVSGDGDDICFPSHGRKTTQIVVRPGPGAMYGTLESAIVRGATGSAQKTITFAQPLLGSVIGVTSKNDLLALPEAFTTTATASVEIQFFSLNGSSSQSHTYWLQLPKPAKVREAALSNSGDKIAWVLSIGYIDHLYISDLRGSHWQDLGWTPEAMVNNGAFPPTYPVWPNTLRWPPGDKAISFIVDGQLFELDIR